MSNGDQVELFARVLLAVVLGTLIGLEREYRGMKRASAPVRWSAVARRFSGR